MKRILLLLTILTLSTTNVFAWGHVGHSLVADVAFNNLDSKTKQTVLKYLNGMSIEDTANWMDVMRSNKSLDFMKPYHYVDYEKGAAVTELSGDNIISILTKSLKDLDNIKGLSNNEIQTRLFYLFHLIGDLHQPLHVGYKDDKGGNTVQVSFFGRGSNLHAMWDSDIIEYKNITLSDVLKMNTYQPNELIEIKRIDVIDWAKDSRKYLKNVYNLQSAKISDFYIDDNYPIIKEQILKAGLRLASVLEHCFKNVEFDASNTSSTTSSSKEEVVDVVESSVNIDIEKAKDYEDKLIYTCSKVYSTKVLESNGMTFLNVGGEYPNSPLTIVIYKDSLSNFDNVPAEFYKGKNICVIGKVKIYKGKAEIIVNTQHAIQIK